MNFKKGVLLNIFTQLLLYLNRNDKLGFFFKLVTTLIKTHYKGTRSSLTGTNRTRYLSILYSLPYPQSYFNRNNKCRENYVHLFT